MVCPSCGIHASPSGDDTSAPLEPAATTSPGRAATARKPTLGIPRAARQARASPLDRIVPTSPTAWGRGFASAALDAFLQLELTRTLFARLTEHNIGSVTVLTRAGFAQIGSKRAGFAQIGSKISYADGVGRDVVERVYRLAS